MNEIKGGTKRRGEEREAKRRDGDLGGDQAERWQPASYCLVTRGERDRANNVHARMKRTSPTLPGSNREVCVAFIIRIRIMIILLLIWFTFFFNILNYLY